MSKSIVGAITAKNEASARTVKPMTKIFLCPKVSYSRDPSSNRVPKAITCALKIHCNPCELC